METGRWFRDGTLRCLSGPAPCPGGGWGGWCSNCYFSPGRVLLPKPKVKHRLSVLWSNETSLYIH